MQKQEEEVVVCTFSSLTDKLSAGCQEELVRGEDEGDRSSCSPGILSTCVSSVMLYFLKLPEHANVEALG